MRNGFATLRYANKDNIYDKKGILARTKNELTRIKRASLDARRRKRKTPKGSVLGVHDPKGAF